MKGMQGGYIYANLIVCAAFKNLAKRFPRLTYFAASGCHKLGPDLLDELLPYQRPQRAALDTHCHHELQHQAVLPEYVPAYRMFLILI
jgi:hypothetical protein